MIQVYHNPRCRKSRAGLQYIQDKGLEHEVILYLKDQAFDEAALRDILKKLDMQASELLRTQEDIFKKEIKGKDLSENEIIRKMIENPRIISRPIVVHGEKAVVADPAENTEKII
jgi:arsenate reductase